MRRGYIPLTFIAKLRIYGLIMRTVKTRRKISIVAKRAMMKEKMVRKMIMTTLKKKTRLKMMI